MFFNFFYGLRTHGIKVSLHEYLALMEGLKKEFTDYTIDDFYYLCKTIMVKQEAQLDRFDRVFGHYFKGVELIPDEFFTQKNSRRLVEKRNCEKSCPKKKWSRLKRWAE